MQMSAGKNADIILTFLGPLSSACNFQERVAAFEHNLQRLKWKKQFPSDPEMSCMPLLYTEHFNKCNPMNKSGWMSSHHICPT